jgi:hypothetical protein
MFAVQQWTEILNTLGACYQIKTNTVFCYEQKLQPDFYLNLI